MNPHLLIRSGARAGTQQPLGHSRIRIGRRPDLEVVLDPEQDLEVSALHAELVSRDGEWYLRDLGSRNGTFLNGRPLGPSPVPVRHGDEILLGPRGPLLELRLEDTPQEDVQGPAASPKAPATAQAPSPRASYLPQRRNLGLRFTVIGLTALLVLAVAGLALATAVQRSAWESERAELEARADSLMEAGERTAQSLEGELSELGEALERSRAELDRIQVALAAAEAREGEPDPPARQDVPPASQAQLAEEAEELRRQLRDATAALERQQLAASLDFDAIQDANRLAIGLLFVEFDDGTVVTGTAFAVDADGTMVTSRHVLMGEDGNREPTRVAVQFTDSQQVFPARLAAASTEWDLAMIVVEVGGEVPTVAGLNLRPDTLSSGTPMASMGFALGGEAVGADGSRTHARPLLSAGILLGQGDGYLEIQGYGEPGASGSPIFDADGKVAGILFGGRQEGEGRILIAVPAPAIHVLWDAMR